MLGTEHVHWLIVNLVQLPLSSLAVLSVFIIALLQFGVGHLHIMLLSVCEIRALLQFFVLADVTLHSTVYCECRETA